MPQVYNLPDRIQSSNYAEAELLNRGFMENVFNTRQRLIKRNQRAADIKRVMQKNPNIFGPGGAQVDTFGNEDIDRNKARVQDDSLIQGASTQSITNEVINPLDEFLKGRNTQNSDAAVNNIYGKQAEIMGMQKPNYNNSSTPGTLGLLGASGGSSFTPLQSSSQQAIIDQGLLNQQQLLGQNQAPPPLGTGTVLAPNNSLAPPPLTMQNSQYPLSASTSMKQSQSSGVQTGHGENYTVSAKDNGYSHETGLLTRKTTNNKVNLIDPVKKNVDDLRGFAELDGSNFEGAVNPLNNYSEKELNTKVDYLAELNKALGTAGTIEEQTIEKLKTEEKGKDASLTYGYRDNSSVNFGEMNFGNSNIREAANGGKPDPNLEATKMSWLGSEQDPSTGQWSQITTTKDGRWFIGSTTSAGKVFDTWKSGKEALGVLEKRISNLPYSVKDETDKGGNSKFVGYDESGKAAGAIAWDQEKRKWRVIGYDGGSTAVMLHLSGMIQNGFDMKELNQKAAEINVKTNQNKFD